METVKQNTTNTYFFLNVIFSQGQGHVFSLVKVSPTMKTLSTDAECQIICNLKSCREKKGLRGYSHDHTDGISMSQRQVLKPGPSYLFLVSISYSLLLLKLLCLQKQDKKYSGDWRNKIRGQALSFCGNRIFTFYYF